MTRTKQIMAMTEAISNLKAKCVATQSSLYSSNKAIRILKRKYQTLKELRSQCKVNLVKEIRQDQLLAVKDSHNNEIVLGQGRFGICKLMSLSVSGESVKVAVKHYTELTKKEAVVDEACLLSQISHEAFPFVFGVVFGELHNTLVLEVCGITEGIEHSFTIHRALQSKSVCVTETSWLHILMQCCKGFHYLHSTGIVHNDIKGDNILIAKVNLGEWQPKIIDFNKACEIKTSKIKEIPVSERARLKSCHKHIDPALYDGQYAPGPTSDVYSFGYMASKIAKSKKSELIDRFAVTCMSKYRRPTFDILLRDLEAVITL